MHNLIRRTSFLLLFVSSFNMAWGKISPQKIVDKEISSKVSSSLLSKYKKSYKDSKQLDLLRKETLAMKRSAVPSLIQVMKDSSFPDKNRWMATFLLGRIMGKKSAPFISKFLKHPSWVMRMASLKTLLALKMNEKSYGDLYAHALKDNSFIVRTQALENIRELKLGKYAPYVWAMLYDKRNYYTPKQKGLKRTNLIKRAVKTVGELGFDKAKEPLFKMVQKKKYEDIFKEMEYSLEKISGKKAPDGNLALKRRFWKRISLQSSVIR